MWMELNSSLPTYATAYKLIALSLVFFSHCFFPQLLRHEIDIVASYCVVPYLQNCYAWVVTINMVDNC